MAVKIIAIKTTHVEFKEVGTSGVFIAQTVANQEDSMAILKQNGFRALTYQEALVKIDQNPELKVQLKDELFYLSGKGHQLSGYYIFNDKGEIKITQYGKGDLEKTIYVCKGNQPLSLYVRTDSAACGVGRRYYLDANVSPDRVAQVVVGVAEDREAAAPKIDIELVKEFRHLITELRIAEASGIITPEIVKVATKVLRAVE